MIDLNKEIQDLEAPLLSNDNDETEPVITQEHEHGGGGDEIQVMDLNHIPPTGEVVMQAPTAEIMDFNDNDSVFTTRTEAAVRGRWRDGLCACCTQGCCHPSLLCSWFCPSIAIAQVMMRLNLLMSGKQGSQSKAKCTFFAILAITGLFYAINLLFVDATVLGVMSFLFALFLMYLTYTTRLFIRQRYGIPEGCCVGCEDVCVSIFCHCCTISQMARHTVDYDTYRASVCSTTGIPGSVPVSVA